MNSAFIFAAPRGTGKFRNYLKKPWWLSGKEFAWIAGDPGSLLLGSGRSPGEGNGYPLQYSCMDRGFHGQRSLVGCSPWDHKESNTTERLTLSLSWLFALDHVKIRGSYLKIEKHQLWLESLK